MDRGHPMPRLRGATERLVCVFSDLTGIYPWPQSEDRWIIPGVT